MISKIDKSWRSLQYLLFENPLLHLREEVLYNISHQPSKEDIFKIFEKPLGSIKVVIVGEEPSVIPGESTGRAFSISSGRKLSKVLKVIKAEIYNSDEDWVEKEDWQTLEHWEEQGVFLLNTALTVETGKGRSHILYWKGFTEKLISLISQTNPCVWVFWGKRVEKYIPFISKPFSVDRYDIETIKMIPSNPDWNYILTAPHPIVEYFDIGEKFYGCNHFIFINEILKKLKKQNINW